jgi:leucyl-tRNA synthetase
MMGYGTGAIMAVPAHDQRDYDFAKAFGLPIQLVVAPQAKCLDLDSLIAEHAFEADGIAVNSEEIDGLPTAQAKEEMTALLEAEGIGRKSIKYKLRDWLFSRQRYWGEPFPIVLDENGDAFALNDDELPLTLPDMEDFKPTGTPEPPLSKAKDWLKYQRDGRSFTRETNTMPQWAGSCWYYLRYLDPHNDTVFVDKAKEKYWMPVDLYVGGVEHAVLHLLYARFWHKVLFDLQHVGTPEPFARLVNQGLILGEMEYHVFATEAGQVVTASEARDIVEEATTDKGLQLIATSAKTGQRLVGRRVTEDQIEKTANGFRLKSDANIRVDARSFKMSKSRGNVVNPDSIVAEYGADTFRLYEMYMGPLEAQKPWNTRDIVGMSRFLASVWRNLIGQDEPATGSSRLGSAALAEPLERQLHRTIKKVGEDIQAMRFNTAIAELIKLNNEITGMETVPQHLAETFALLLSPLAPHIAEELWQRLGHQGSLARVPWPAYDPAKLVESEIELPIQVNGRLRDKITVPAGASQDVIFAAAEAATNVKPWLAGKSIVKRLYVPGKLVNIVVK